MATTSGFKLNLEKKKRRSLQLTGRRRSRDSSQLLSCRKSTTSHSNRSSNASQSLAEATRGSRQHLLPIESADEQDLYPFEMGNKQPKGFASPLRKIIPSDFKIATDVHDVHDIPPNSSNRSKSNSSECPRNIGRMEFFFNKTQNHLQLPSQLFLSRLHPKKGTNVPYGIDAQTTKDVNAMKDLLKVPPYIIQPNSHFLFRWNILLFILLVYTALVTPYEMAFYPSNSGPFFYIDCFLNTVFVLDIAINFFSSFYEQDKFMRRQYVTSLRRIARRYMKSHFLMDFVSALPVGLIPLCTQEPPGSYTALRVVRFARLARGFRLLRLIKMTKLFRLLDHKFMIGYATEALTKYCFLLVLVGHWLACLWGGVAQSQFHHHNDSWIANFCPSWECDPDSLLEKHFELYTSSIYFSIMTITSIGYGNIVPASLAEHWVCVLMMLLGASVWAYTIGNASSIIATMGSDMVEYNRLMDNLRGFVKANNYPAEVKKELYQYFRAYKNMIRREVNSEVLNHMSPQLQHFVILWGADWVKKVRWMQALSPTVVTEMLHRMTTMLYCPGETMPSCDALCKMNSGVGSRFGRVMVKGGTWGSDMILQSDLLMRKTKVKAITYCEVMYIERADFFELLEKYPDQKREIRKWAGFIALRRALRLIGITSKQNWVVDKKITCNRMRLTSEELNANEIQHLTSVVHIIRTTHGDDSVEEEILRKNKKENELSPPAISGRRRMAINPRLHQDYVENLDTFRPSSNDSIQTGDISILTQLSPSDGISFMVKQKTKPPLQVWTADTEVHAPFFSAQQTPESLQHEDAKDPVQKSHFSCAESIHVSNNNQFESEIRRELLDLRELVENNREALGDIRDLIIDIQRDRDQANYL